MSDNRKIAVALLTCDRLKYTQKTVRTFLRRNNAEDFHLFYADDASTQQEIHAFVQEHDFEPVLLNKQRLGCTPTSDGMIREIRRRIGDDGLILYLQNDFQFLRPIPLDVVERVFVELQPHTLRLYGKYKNVFRRRWDRGARRVSWKAYDFGPEVIQVATRARWSWNPSITPAGVLAELAHGALREKTLMRRSRRRKFITARFAENITSHFGRRRTPQGIYKSETGYGT